MKKSLLFLFAAALGLVACEKGTTFADLENETETVTPVDGPTKNFTFTVKGEFEAATFKAPAKRKAPTAYLNDTGNEMTDLWVYDYMGGKLVQSVHQGADDENCGKPKMSLAYGEPHIYFVASRGADPVINDESHIISWSTVRDTFWKDYEVNVVSTSNGTRAVTLDRVATKLRILIDDEVPAACASISLTPDRWYYGLDWVTGEAVTAQKKAVSVSVPESYVGTIGQLAVSVFGLSGASEWTTNISVTATDTGGNTIGSATINGAPFKRNRATEYHGALFGSAGSMVVSVNSDWDDSVTGTW
jgi:hypothetical protein